MSDPIEDRLNDFDPGGPVNPISAAEVRRRGDRMRRRNTAFAVVGAAAAVVLIATPIAVLAGGSDDRDTDPAGPPTSTPSSAPSSAPNSASAGLSDDDLLTATDLPPVEGFTDWKEHPGAPGRTLGCQSESWEALGAGDSVARDFGSHIPPGPANNSGSTDDTAVVRTAVLQFADADAAATAYATVETLISRCPDGIAGQDSSSIGVTQPTGGGTRVTRGWVYAAPEFCPEGCDAAWFERMGVAQVDDRLVLVSTVRLGGPLEPDGLDAEMNQVFGAAVERAQPGGDAGSSPSQPSDPGSAAGVTSIPSDFPIDQGIEAALGDGGEKSGPSADADGVTYPDGFCTTWPPEGSTDRLAVTVTGPEYLQARELLTFSSADEASAAVDVLRGAVVDCEQIQADDPANDITFQLLPDDTGRNSATFAHTYAQGTGGSIYQVTQIGDAVLATVDSSEWTVDTIQRGADELSTRNAPLYDEMCGFTGTC